MNNNLDNLYKQKYLKYKNKYVELKQMGGTNGLSQCLHLVQTAKSMSGGSEHIVDESIPDTNSTISTIVEQCNTLNINFASELAKLIISNNIINYNLFNEKNSIININETYTNKRSIRYVINVLNNTNTYLTTTMSDYINLYNSSITIINTLINNGKFTYFIETFANLRNEFNYTYEISRHTVNLSNILLFKNKISTLTKLLINDTNEYVQKPFNGAEFYEIIFFYLKFIKNLEFYNTLQLFTSDKNSYNIIDYNLDHLCNIMHAGWAYYSLYKRFNTYTYTHSYFLYNNPATDSINNLNVNALLNLNTSNIQIKVKNVTSQEQAYTVPVSRLLAGQFQEFNMMPNYSVNNYLTIEDSNSKKIVLPSPNKFGDDVFSYTIWV